jgi:hypothetical protein
MLVRDIELPVHVTAANGFKDTTSAYGYGGPIVSPDTPDDVCRRFTQVLQDFLQANNVVAAFSRLHPILDNAHILTGLGEMVDFGVTVSVDLTLPPDVQFANYRRCHKQSIYRLLDRGFTCIKAGKERLDDFMNIYYETMDRNHAESYYYFDRSYIEYLLEDMRDNTCMIICDDGPTAVSCCLSLSCNGIVQGHIGGTLNRYLSMAPMKLVLDTVRRWACENEAHTLNLGGGVGGRQDSVLSFKQGFSKRQHTCSLWRHVVQPTVYQEICSEVVRATGIEPAGDYFPEYRNPAFCSQESQGAAAV